MTQPLEISLVGKNFTIGFPNHSGTIPTYTALSLINSFRKFDEIGIPVNYIVELNNSIVDSARNNVVHTFLNSPDQQCLIFIDSDMMWEPDDLVRLCGWSTQYPIVAGMYSTKSETDPKFLGDYWKDPTCNQVMGNGYGLVRMTGLGLGFCAIQRSVFETMIPKTRSYPDPRAKGKVYRFFSTVDDTTGDFVGEDIYFLRRWTIEFGGELWVDPFIKLGHIGQKVYRGDPEQSIIEYNKKLLEG